MSLHVFANIITPFGIAANNRGETAGNTTQLQKIIWKGMPHTTVSAEAIRYALRQRLQENGGNLNRHWDEDSNSLKWRSQDPKKMFDDFQSGSHSYIDDDLLGFMSAEAADAEADETKGKATVRRSVLEVTRAISITPWNGEYVFNAASPSATPQAAKGEGNNPVPYQAEVHATRYQFGLSMTPERLKKSERALAAIQAFSELSNVGGNHSRFLFDFAPDAVVIRITHDPSPRMLYCFDAIDEGRDIGCVALKSRIELGDVLADELFVGVSDLDCHVVRQLEAAGVPKSRIVGTRKAFALAGESLQKQLPVGVAG